MGPGYPGFAGGEIGCTVAEDEVEPSGLPAITSPAGAAGPGLPSPWGVSGQSGRSPVLQARPLSCSGTGEGQARPGYPTGRLNMCLGHCW